MKLQLPNHLKLKKEEMPQINFALSKFKQGLMFGFGIIAITIFLILITELIKWWRS